MLIVTAKLSLQTTSCSAISACNNKVQSLELNSPANTAASRLKAKSQKKKITACESQSPLTEEEVIDQNQRRPEEHCH